MASTTSLLTGMETPSIVNSSMAMNMTSGSDSDMTAMKAQANGMSTALVLAVSTAFLFAATTAYLLRMLQPFNRRLSFIIGQIVITISFLFLCAIFGLTVVLTSTHTDGAPTEMMNKFPYLIDAITNAQIFATKFSFALSLLSFSELSPNLRYRRIVKYVVIFQGVWVLTILPHDILCLPLSTVWQTVLNGGKTAHCQNFRISYYVFASLELVDDLMLLLLPMFVILSLPGKHQYYGTMFLFLLGACVLFADILKFIFIPQYGLLSSFQESQPNPHSNTLVWSFVAYHLKSYVSLVVACLPNVRVTLNHLFNRRKYPGDSQHEIEVSETKSEGQFKLSKTAISVKEVSDIELDMTQKPQETIVASFEKSDTISDKGTVDVVLREAFVESSNLRSTSSSTTTPMPLDTTRSVVSEDPMTSIMSDMYKHLDSLSAVQPKWQELYPTRDVEIRPFGEQFDRRRIRPTYGNAASDSPILTPTFSQASFQDVVGRSALQKDYPDLVMQRRMENVGMPQAQDTRPSAQRQTSETSLPQVFRDSPTF